MGDAAAPRPSIDAWLAELRSELDAERVGMYLVHNGVVRGTARDGRPVGGMILSRRVDEERRALAEAAAREGIAAVRVWINEGRLAVGDDIMVCLVAGDIREHVLPVLQDLVRDLKTNVVCESEVAATLSAET